MNIIRLQYMSNIQKSIDYVNKTYDKLSYFDVYGGSVVFCIVLIVIIVFFFFHSKIRMAIVPIRNNWAKYRCNPLVMPFAAYIVEPKDVPWLKFTGNNFTFCANNILTNIVSYFMLPIQFILVPLLFMWKIILQVLQAIRKIFYYIREQMKKITANIMNRVFGVMIQIQKMAISLRDMFAKIRGAMVAAIYTLLGTYYAIKSALGAIMELCIIILIAMAAMIIIFWTMPWTWGVAAALTTIFVMLSIPVIYIIVFMDQILRTQPSSSMPGKPRKPGGCFDGNTMICVKDGKGRKGKKPIKDIVIGDTIDKGGIVTGFMKVLLDNDSIGTIDGIIVTACHYVFYDKKWIRSCDHPDYYPLSDYNDKYVYCLNTSTKTINIEGTIFADWDDMTKIDEVYNYNKKYREMRDEFNQDDQVDLHAPENIHRNFDGGLVGETVISTFTGPKLISDIKVGQQLDLGNIVLAVVEIEGRDIDQYVIDVTRNSTTGKSICLRGSNNIIYTNGVTNIANKSKNTTIINYKNKKRLEYNRQALYHLVTSSGKFIVGEETTVYDYNSCLDFFE